MEVEVFGNGLHAGRSLNNRVVELHIGLFDSLKFSPFVRFYLVFGDMALGYDHMMSLCDDIIGEVVLKYPPMGEILDRAVSAQWARAMEMQGLVRVVFTRHSAAAKDVTHGEKYTSLPSLSLHKEPCYNSSINRSAGYL